MNLLRKLAVVVVLMSPMAANADVIEFDIDYALSESSIRGDFGDGQLLGGVATFFGDTPIVFGAGDTVIANILFDQRLQLFDFGESTVEQFSFGLTCGLVCIDDYFFFGTWISSVELLGGLGSVWSDPVISNFNGGGGGYGGGWNLDITDNQGSFSGIRYVAEFTTVSLGDPFTLGAFTGLDLRADGIKILPVPEPGTLALFGIGLFGMGLARRRKKI